MDRPLPTNSKFKNSDYERLHRTRLEQIASQKEGMVDITVVRSVRVAGHAGYVPDETTKHSLSIQFLRFNNMDEVLRELDVSDDMHLQLLWSSDYSYGFLLDKEHDHCLHLSYAPLCSPVRRILMMGCSKSRKN